MMDHTHCNPVYCGVGAGAVANAAQPPTMKPKGTQLQAHRELVVVCMYDDEQHDAHGERTRMRVQQSNTQIIQINNMHSTARRIAVHSTLHTPTAT